MPHSADSESTTSLYSWLDSKSVQYCSLVWTESIMRFDDSGPAGRQLLKLHCLRLSEVSLLEAVACRAPAATGRSERASAKVLPASPIPPPFLSHCPPMSGPTSSIDTSIERGAASIGLDKPLDGKVEHSCFLGEYCARLVGTALADFHHKGTHEGCPCERKGLQVPGLVWVGKAAHGTESVASDQQFLVGGNHHHPNAAGVGGDFAFLAHH